MSEDKRKEREARRDPVAVNPEGEARDIALFIHRLWQNGEDPQFLEVWQVAGKLGDVRKNRIVQRKMQSNGKKDLPTAVEIANTILASAQEDCDKIVRREQRYRVEAIDRARGADPYDSWPLTLKPKRLYLDTSEGKSEDGEDGEDGDGALNERKMTLRFLDKFSDLLSTERQNNTAITGELLLLYRSEVETSRAWADSIMGQFKGLFSELMAAQREGNNGRIQEILAKEHVEASKSNRRWDDLKIYMANEGVRTTRNMLTAFFGDAKREGGGGQQQPALPANGEAHPASLSSPEERQIIDTIKHDAEEITLPDGRKLDLVLFGDWDKNADGTMRLVTPGLFTERQSRIMFAVIDGQLPIDRLNDLDPLTRHADAVTQKQLDDMDKMGVPNSVAMQFGRLVFLLRSKRAAAPAPAPAAQPVA